MKVLLEIVTPEDVKEKIEALGYETYRLPKDWKENTPDLSDINFAIGAQNLKHLPWDEMKEIKGVFLKSVGIDYLPLESFKERGILLTNNNGAYALPIGEFIVFNILQLAKQNQRFLENQRKKVWDNTFSLETLVGRKVLFLGTGTIAQEAAKRLAPFGMEIFGYNRSGREVPEFSKIYTNDNLDEILGSMDYIVFCLPGTPETDHFFNKDFLEKIKDGVKIINISRGSVIDEKVLLEGLKSGKVAGAALDVFEKEPLPKDSELWTLDNVYLSPHLSYHSENDAERKYSIIVKNLEHFKNGEDLENLIDYDRGY
ncbi:MAG: NAD(P)-dependent oxidoreductase [Tissierellia bacterium]|nr:NAD(P)-dependent oxidoreductase [Tissierellia bacterium]